ncbi:MAG TPA: hypothetical protein V6D08_11460 [Candidatus Obscuribacterales bacterium]
MRRFALFNSGARLRGIFASSALAAIVIAAAASGQGPAPGPAGLPLPADLQPAPSSVPGKVLPAAPAGQAGSAPLIVPPITFVDINSGRFGKLEIDLEDGQFMDGAVDRLRLVAKNMDLRQGSLAALDVEMTGGHLQDFTFDRLSLSTQGTLTFDTGVLFNHRMLQFINPAVAEVMAVVTQESLNRFVNSPNTLNRLSVAAFKQTGILESLLGNANLLTITGANVALQKNSRVFLTMQTRLGVGEMAIPVPLELNTQMVLRDGWVYLTDTHLTTAGQEISPQLSQLIVDKVNNLSSWGHRSDDIQFNFTSLKVVPGDKFVLQGTAYVRRLRFGRI